MSDNSELEKRPRADSLRVHNDHNNYALHKFWGEYDHMPHRFRNYHDGRVINGEKRPGYFDEYIPVTSEGDRGAVLRKEVEEKTTYCDSCEVAARKNSVGEAQCPECGLICVTTGPSQEVVYDAKAAGRYNE
jgi:predicted RNA-binding Zn-ribbon protein involved in translation (DUF1610 family)